MLTDPVAKMFCSILNASRFKKDSVVTPLSSLKVSIFNLFASRGLIKGFEVVDNDGRSAPFIKISLKYDNRGIPMINGIKRESKPSFRKYSSYKGIGRSSPLLPQRGRSPLRAFGEVKNMVSMDYMF